MRKVLVAVLLVCGIVGTTRPAAANSLRVVVGLAMILVATWAVALVRVVVHS